MFEKDIKENKRVSYYFELPLIRSELTSLGLIEIIFSKSKSKKA